MKPSKENNNNKNHMKKKIKEILVAYIYCYLLVINQSIKINQKYIYIHIFIIEHWWYTKRNLRLVYLAVSSVVLIVENTKKKCIKLFSSRS